MSQTILTTVDNKIMTITLNRPEVYNALSTELVRNLKEALLEGNQRDDVNVIVITGNGGVFSTGADIKEFSKQIGNVELAKERANLTTEIHSLIPSLDKVVIASVEGYAFAGGCGIALACDLVVASEKAQFSYPEIIKGFVPAIVSPNLVRIAGRKRAFELLITGNRISAQYAYEIGVINHVVPTEELQDKTYELASKLASYSATALKMTKELFYQVGEKPFNEAIEIAKNTNVKMRQTEDFKKGVESFVNK